MKIIFRTAAIAALIILNACSSDDTSSSDQQSEEQAEELESAVLDVNVVSDNVRITGSTKTEGAPPSPNGAISLDASATSKTALLNEGFDITMSSDATIVGAYLRFKDENGTVADSYYDISIEENTSYKSSKKSSRLRRDNNAFTAKVDDFTLDVDFGEAIEPGTFCYELCVYDAEGNISLPEEVCATVESWGGNDELIGKWNMFKDVAIFGGESSTTLVGEDSCDNEDIIACNNGDSFIASEYCYTTNNSSFTFEADGTFVYTFSDTHKELKSNDSKEACVAINYEFDHSELTKGKWAYIQDINELILIYYSDLYTYDGETETRIFEPGDGAIFAEIGIFLVDDVIRLGPEEESSVNSYYQK